MTKIQVDEERFRAAVIDDELGLAELADRFRMSRAAASKRRAAIYATLPQQIRGLTMMQPWATLVAIGAKKIETRSAPTSYRGPIAVHASLAWPRAAQNVCSRPAFKEKLIAGGIRFVTKHGRPTPVLRHGYILAVVDIVDCVRVEDLESAPISIYEHAFGDYQPGRFAWKLANLRPLPAPIACKGYLSLWTVPPTIAVRLPR